MTIVPLYALTGVLLFTMGMSGVFFCRHPLRKILAINLAGSGLFLILVSLARRSDSSPPDSIPHALVLTGIVVAVSATAVALACYRSLSTVADPAVSQEGPPS